MIRGRDECMTTKEIVIDYLKANGFDGLYSDDCGCSISDLMPCDGYGSVGMCKPGVKKNCKECSENGECDQVDDCIGERPCP